MSGFCRASRLHPLERALEEAGAIFEYRPQLGACALDGCSQDGHLRPTSACQSGGIAKAAGCELSSRVCGSRRSRSAALAALAPPAASTERPCAEPGLAVEGGKLRDHRFCAAGWMLLGFSVCRLGGRRTVSSCAPMRPEWRKMPRRYRAPTVAGSRSQSNSTCSSSVGSWPVASRCVAPA